MSCAKHCWKHLRWTNLREILAGLSYFELNFRHLEDFLVHFPLTAMSCTPALQYFHKMVMTHSRHWEEKQTCQLKMIVEHQYTIEIQELGCFATYNSRTVWSNTFFRSMALRSKPPCRTLSILHNVSLASTKFLTSVAWFINPAESLPLQ